MELITAGNPNIGTLASVLHIVPIHYGKPLTKILFIDTEGSGQDESGEPIDAARNSLVRQAAGSRVQIAQQYIPRKELATEIPGVLSCELQTRSSDEIVIDLTNGSKSISSLLYAAGSLLQVRRLFFLTVVPAARSKKPSEYSTSDYWVEDIDPLQNIRALGRHGFFDLIYYRDAIASLVSGLHDGLRISSDSVVEQNLIRAVEDYFKGNYLGCTSVSGQLAEELVLLLCEKVKNRLKGAITRKMPTNFADATIFLTHEFCEPLRSALRDSLPLNELQNDFAAFRNADKLLEYLRVLRNDAAHPRSIAITKDEAKASLDATISLICLLRKE